MELLIFMSVLLAVVTLGLGQNTQRVNCKLNDEVACLRAELSVLKVTVDENRVLRRENAGLLDTNQNLTTELQAERSNSVNLQNEVKQLNTLLTDLTTELQAERNNSAYLQNEVNRLNSSLPGVEEWINGGHTSNSNYNEVITKIRDSNSKRNLYTFDNKVYGMSLIDGQLWVPVRYSHSIQILDPNMSKKIREIPLTNIHPQMGPRSVHQINSNEVLLAAEQGLYVLGKKGSLSYKVGGGKITDIVMRLDCYIAYLYNSTDGNVVTVSYTVGKWVRSYTFTAYKSHNDEFNTITFLLNQIYIAYYSDSNIRAYSTTGTYVKTYGVSGTNSPGQLKYPYICGTDSNGSLLVCDWQNYRLQVLSPDGTWHVYVLPGVTYPREVVVDTSGNLWLLWWHTNYNTLRISKFSVL